MSEDPKFLELYNRCAKLNKHHLVLSYMEAMANTESTDLVPGREKTKPSHRSNKRSSDSAEANAEESGSHSREISSKVRVIKPPSSEDQSAEQKLAVCAQTEHKNKPERHSKPSLLKEVIEDHPTNITPNHLEGESISETFSLSSILPNQHKLEQKRKKQKKMCFGQKKPSNFKQMEQNELKYSGSSPALTTKISGCSSEETANNLGEVELQQALKAKKASLKSKSKQGVGSKLPVTNQLILPMSEMKSEEVWNENYAKSQRLGISGKVECNTFVQPKSNNRDKDAYQDEPCLLENPKLKPKRPLSSSSWKQSKKRVSTSEDRQSNCVSNPAFESQNSPNFVGKIEVSPLRSPKCESSAYKSKQRKRTSSCSTKASQSFVKCLSPPLDTNGCNDENSQSTATDSPTSGITLKKGKKKSSSQISFDSKIDTLGTLKIGSPESTKRKSTSDVKASPHKKKKGMSLHDSSTDKVDISMPINVTPHCVVKLTRMSEDEILRLSPTSRIVSEPLGIKIAGPEVQTDQFDVPSVANIPKELKSAGDFDGSFAVPKVPSLKAKISGEPSGLHKMKNKMKKVNNETEKHSKPKVGGHSCYPAGNSEKVHMTGSGDAEEPAFNIFENFYKPKAQVDPLDKVEIDTNTLDYELEDDNDDALSLFAESTMFQNEADEEDDCYSRKDSPLADNKSSFDSDEYSKGVSDMDLEDGEESDDAFPGTVADPPKGEVGIVVENYVVEEGHPTESPELQDDVDKVSCQDLVEAPVLPVTCIAAPSKISEIVPEIEKELTTLDEGKIFAKTIAECDKDGEVEVTHHNTVAKKGLEDTDANGVTSCSDLLPEIPMESSSNHKMDLGDTSKDSLSPVPNCSSIMNLIPLDQENPECTSIKNSSSDPKSSEYSAMPPKALTQEKSSKNCTGDQSSCSSSREGQKSSNGSVVASSLVIQSETVQHTTVLDTSQKKQISPTSQRSKFNNRKKICVSQDNGWDRKRTSLPIADTPGVFFKSPKRINQDVERHGLLPHPEKKAGLLPTPEKTRPNKLTAFENRSFAAVKDIKTGFLPIPLSLNWKPSISPGPSTTPPMNYDGRFSTLDIPVVSMVNSTTQLQHCGNSQPVLDGSNPVICDPFNQSPPLVPSSRPLMPRSTNNSFVPKDCTELSLKDTDLRNKDVDMRLERGLVHVRTSMYGDVTENLLKKYCLSFLKTGSCSHSSCILLHETIDVICKHETSDSVVRYVQVMVQKYPFWMKEKLHRVIRDLGSLGNKKALLSICELIWQRDCRLKRAKNPTTPFQEFSADWAVMAEALAICGLSPSDAVKLILDRCKTAPEFDVLDNIIYVLYPKFIRGQSNLWDSIGLLANLKEYEIPILVIGEVLKDAMQDLQEKTYLPEICNYLLNSPKPSGKTSEEKDVINLLKKFVTMLRKDFGKPVLADKLESHYGFIPNQLHHLARIQTPPRASDGKRFGLLSRERKTAWECYEPAQNELKQPFQDVAKSQALSGNMPHQNTPSNQESKGFQVKKNTQNLTDLTKRPESNCVPKEDTMNTDPVAQSAQLSSLCPNPVLLQHSSNSKEDERISLKIVVRDSGRGVTAVSNFDTGGLASNEVQGNTNSSSKLRDHIKPLSKPASRRLMRQPATKTGTNNRLRTKSICELIEERKFGVAAGTMVNWRTPAEISHGISFVSSCFKKLDTDKCLSSFKSLLDAIHSHWTGSNSDSHSKFVIVSVGVDLAQHFIKINQSQEAFDINELLWKKVNPLDDKLCQFPKATLLLTRAKVLFGVHEVHPSYKIVQENRFFDFPARWVYPPEERDIDTIVNLRDEICEMLFDRLKSTSVDVEKAADLFRCMLDAKKSYKLDVGVKFYDSILTCLVQSNYVPKSLELFMWAYNRHNLAPNTMTVRLLLMKITEFGGRESPKYSPEVLSLLGLEPYKNALPQSIEGMQRVPVVLQSNWFCEEVHCIFTFLINCHLSNLQSDQDFPDIEVFIEEADPLVQPAGMEEITSVFSEINSSIPAMGQRVAKTLGKLVPDNCMVNKTLRLDRTRVRECVQERRSQMRREDRFASPRGRGILSAAHNADRPSAGPSHQSHFHHSQYPSQYQANEQFREQIPPMSGLFGGGGNLPAHHSLNVAQLGNYSMYMPGQPLVSVPSYPEILSHSEYSRHPSQAHVTPMSHFVAQGNMPHEYPPPPMRSFCGTMPFADSQHNVQHSSGVQYRGRSSNYRGRGRGRGNGGRRQSWK